MYIDAIELRNFRTFRHGEISFVHPQQDFGALGFPRRPQLSNVNLLLGDNGQGKTALLKAIALACLGPAVRDSGIYPFRLIRRGPRTFRLGRFYRASPKLASIKATFTPHPQ